MKKNNIVLLLISFFFINILSVQAGVCNGDKGYNYCGVDKTLDDHNISFTSKGTLDGTYFIRAGYEAKINGQSYASVCLDPALSAPAEPFRNVRELDLSTTYDQGVYKLYQKFINEINYVDYSYNMAYFQYATRIWTIKNGFAYVSEGVDYENDAATFIGCSKLIDSSITTTTTKGVNNSDEANCFASQKDMIQEYYNKVKENFLWSDPFENNSNITTSGPNLVDGNYVFAFTVDFKDFFTKYSNSINKGNVKLNSAQFKACISINDEDCFQDESKIRWINNELGNTDNNVFTLTLTPDEYNTYFPTGEASVTLNYSYHHPMNPDNVFFSRYNANEMGYQRMLIIKEHETKGRKTIGVSKFVENNTCSHTLSGFINAEGNNVSTIAAYYASCGCTANESLLSEGDLDFYKNMCSDSIVNESYTGNISSCDASQDYTIAKSDTNFENYTLKYNKTTTINSYCSESCDEIIGINNLKGKYTTIAGRFFEFNKYPELIANKTCTVTVKYEDWYNDYYNESGSGLLNKEINNYNNYLFDTAVNSASYIGGGNCTSGTPATTCGSYSTYEYSYKEYYYDGSDELKYYTHSDTYRLASGCCSTTKPASKYTPYSIENSLISLNNHFDDLKNCYTYLNKPALTEANKFYPFNVDLKYYYEQEFSSDKYGWKRNDDKPSNINDSNFKTNDYLSNYSQTGNYADNVYNTDSYVYPYVSATSSVYNPSATKSIGAQAFKNNNNVQINRIVEYGVKYEKPLKQKFVDVYTSKITESLEDNSVELGYVYDIDISAKTGNSKTGHTNANYYEFTILGDSGNNRLFNHFKTGNSIRRYCDYEITSELTECKGNDCKLNVNYRSVDPSNIDPNDRLKENATGDLGFSNWDNDKGYAVKKQIEKRAETNDTYNPEYLEYSFTLDSATIAAIRDYNKGKTYDNFAGYFDCDDDGNKCESSFVNQAKLGKITNSSGAYIDSFATINKGRDSWKEFSQSLGKYYIDGEEVE